MDPNELKQEIERHAAEIISDKNGVKDPAFRRLVASHILLQLEKDDDAQERMEVFMPQMLEAFKGMPGGSKQMIDDMRRHNVELQDRLGQAQNDLRLLAKDVTKHAAGLIGEKSVGMSTARFEMLASQEDVYDLEEQFDDVDWQAIHDLRIRAPRYVDVKRAATQEGAQEWAKDEGAWIYVNKAGSMSFNECQVTGLGYLNENTTAVYLVVDVSEEDEPGTKSLLQWERRFLYTAQMSKGRQEDLKREMKQRKRDQ